MTCQRAVTTPHKLPWFNPKPSICALLTHYERHCPWVLYSTPGLFLTQLVRLIYIDYVQIRLLKWVVLASRYGSFIEMLRNFSVYWTILYLGIVATGIAVLCPLQVVFVRLLIQRNHEKTTLFIPIEKQEHTNGVHGLNFSAQEHVIACVPRCSYLHSLLTFDSAFLSSLAILRT